MTAINEAAPVPSKANLDLVRDFVVQIADPAGLAKRMAELTVATTAAQNAINEAERASKKAREDQLAAAAAILDAQQAHEKKLKAERTAHESAMAERETAVLAKERIVADLEAQGMRTIDEAMRLKAELKGRLAAIRKATE